MLRPKRHDSKLSSAWRIPNGGIHRRYKPAVIYYDGRVEWCVYGSGFHKDTRKYCKAAICTQQETTLMILKYGDILPTRIEECDEESIKLWRRRWKD